MFKVKSSALLRTYPALIAFLQGSPLTLTLTHMMDSTAQCSEHFFYSPIIPGGVLIPQQMTPVVQEARFTKAIQSVQKFSYLTTECLRRPEETPVLAIQVILSHETVF